MQAVILVGGFGTRLQAVVADVPKPMAPIGNKPFLAYLLDYLQRQGITTVIFSVHYLKEKIQDYFKSQYKNIAIQYAIENEPLGTGGAIAHALSLVAGKEPIFVLNGDTFVQLDYRAMYLQHQTSGAVLTMALRAIDDCNRYGKVTVDKNHITEFKEKGEQGPGLINAGVYLLQPELFSHFSMPKQFSVERDFLFPHITTLKPRAFIANAYFIDLGIPEDYQRANLELPFLEIY